MWVPLFFIVITLLLIILIVLIELLSNIVINSMAVYVRGVTYDTDELIIIIF